MRRPIKDTDMYRIIHRKDIRVHVRKHMRVKLIRQKM